MINYTPYTRMYKWEIFPQHVPQPKFYYHMFITIFSYLCQNKAIQSKKELLTLNWYHDIDAKTQYCAWYATLRVSHKPLGHHVIQRKKKLLKIISSFIYRNAFISSTINRHQFSLMKFIWLSIFCSFNFVQCMIC